MQKKEDDLIIGSSDEQSSNVRHLILPDGIKFIYRRDVGDRDITLADIPRTVCLIGEAAFEGCTSLETVIFEAGSTLTILGSDPSAENSIFKNTPALRNVTLPSTLEAIGGHVFEDSGVAEINLPNTLTTIGDYAFSNCDNLTRVDLFANISYLGNYAFYDCNNLVDARPSFGLEFIGALAFGYCDNLHYFIHSCPLFLFYDNFF